MKIDFPNREWDKSVSGLRTKTFESNGKIIRLAEFSEDFVETEWCEKGHIGFVLDGKLEIDFGDQKIIFSKGDGISIPEGKKHIGNHLSKKVFLFLVEENH